MTEDQIERVIEKNIDKLDKALMRGKITEDEYDREIIRLERWGEQQQKYLKDFRF